MRVSASTVPQKWKHKVHTLSISNKYFSLYGRPNETVHAQHTPCWVEHEPVNVVGVMESEEEISGRNKPSLHQLKISSEDYLNTQALIPTVKYIM